MHLRSLLIGLIYLLTLLGCTSEPKQSQPEVTPLLSEDRPIETKAPEQSSSFTVTQEVYDQTFHEIEGLINTLNSLIAGRKFSEWKEYLDQSAIDSMSDPKTLADIAERPILKKFNIKMRNLNDYFVYVVVPSRSNAKLDEILFMDNNHVTAFTVIKGEKSILYQLRRDGTRWKITIW